MPSFRRASLACALFTLCSFAHAGGASTLDVLSLTDSPDPLATGQTSTINTEVRYFAVGHDVGTPHISIDHLVRLKTTVVNPAGTTIRTLASEFSAERPAGQLPGLRAKSVSMLWDGKDAEGEAVPAGTYTYKVQAQRLIRFTFSICGQVRIEEVIIHQSSTKQGTITVSGVQDETPPLIADFAPANGAWTTQARPSLSASFSDDSSGVDPVSVEVLLDGLPVTVAATSDSFTFTSSADLAQGSHTVSISVSDLAGNAANAAWTFSVDTLPPSIADLQPAHGVFLNNPRSAVSAAFSDGASGIGVDAATVVVSLDGLDVTAQALVTPEGVTYQPTADLVEGAHQLLVQISDLLGQSAQGSSSFTLDVSPPVISGLSPAHDSWQNAVRSAVSAAFSDGVGIGVDPLSAVITLNGVDVTGSAQVDAAGFVFTPNADLAQGPHSVTVSVADALGNTATASATIKVDSVPPVIADLVPTADGAIREARPTLSGSFTETGSGVDTATFELSIDDALTAATAEATGFSYTLTEALGEGLHTARAVVRDLADNQIAAEWSFTVDTVQPAIVDLVVSPAGITNNPQPLFSASFSDTGSDAGVDPSRVRILLDGVDVSDQGVITAFGFTFTPGTALAEGPHVLSVRIEDTAGNAVEATAIVDVDVTAPVLTGIADLVLEAVVPEGSDAFFNAIAAQDSLSGVQTLEFDPPSGSVFPLGVTAVTTTATDVAGNAGTSVFNVDVLDRTPPFLNFMRDIQVVAATLEGSVVEYEPAVAEDAASTPTISYSHPSGSVFPPGQTTVTVTATDGAGLQASRTFVVTVQTPVRLEITPPEATIPRNGTQQYTAIVYDAFDQPLVPQPTITWSVDGGTGTISETGFYRTDQAPTDLVGARAGGIGDEDAGVGAFTVQAQAGDLTATASITVQPSVFTVEFVRPLFQSSYSSPATIEFEATAFSDPSPVVKVEFIVFNHTSGQTFKIGEATEVPYTTTWETVLPGQYSVTAQALNEEGALHGALVVVDVYFNIKEIGLPGATQSHAWGLNMHRQAVGASLVDGAWKAFLWDDQLEDPAQDLGPGIAYSITDSGLISGQAGIQGPFSLQNHAALWSEGQRTDLSPDVVGNSVAFSVNALGHAAGFQNDTSSHFVDFKENGAVLWKNAQTNLLWNGAVLPHPEARGINDQGHVVGWKDVSGYRQAVFWENGKLTYLTSGLTQRLDGRGAFAINNRDVAVGEYEGRAAAWFRPTPNQWLKVDLQGYTAFEENDIFTIYSPIGDAGRAYAINGCNDIVGFIEENYPPEQYPEPIRWAAIWPHAGGARDLNELIPLEAGWNLIEARGVNANGDIVGVGKKDGQTKAFLLSTGLDSEGEGTRDNTPPTIIPPEDMVVLAEDETGAIVHYPDPMVMDDHAEPSRLLVYTDPPSGTKLPLGETVVQASVVDECGNVGFAAFRVFVLRVTPNILVAGQQQVVRIQGWTEGNVGDEVNVSFAASQVAQGQVLIVPTDAEGQPLPDLEPAVQGQGQIVSDPTGSTMWKSVRVLVQPSENTLGDFGIQVDSRKLELAINLIRTEVDEPRTPDQDFRFLKNAIVATTQPLLLIHGYKKTGVTHLRLEEREVANGFALDVTDNSSYDTGLNGTVLNLSGLDLDALPYTLTIVEGTMQVGQVDFLLYRRDSEVGEKIVLHHPVGMRTESAEDGTPITFREGTVLIAVSDANASSGDIAPSQFMAENDLLPTGVVRNVGLVIARPRKQETSLLALGAKLNQKATGNIIGVCVDYYQGEEAVTTEFIPQPLKNAYVRGDGSFGAMHQKQWHHFVTRMLPAVEFLKNLAGRDTTKPTLGIVEAAYGEFALTHDHMSINPARLITPWKFDVTVRPPGRGPDDFTVNRITEAGDGDLASLKLNLPITQRNRNLTLPDVPPFPRIENRSWGTSIDHGLGSLTFAAGDGTKESLYVRDNSRNFVLGPAFDLKVRPLGMGGWTLSHVVAAFTKMAEDSDVKVVNYSSSQWVIDDPNLKVLGVTIDSTAQIALLRGAVNELCSRKQKILVCSAGNYRRKIDHRDAERPHFLAPQVWGPEKGTDRSTLTATDTLPDARHLVVVGATELPSILVTSAGGRWVWAGEAPNQVGKPEEKADFSNIGKQITLLAPGQAGAGILMEDGSPKFNLYNGTSAASPFVAATLAQILSIDPSMPPLRAIEILEATADDLGLGVEVQGFGRVNVWKAVLTAANGHLSGQPGRSVGNVAPFTTVVAKDDEPSAKYYGLEIRTTGEEATVWLRTGALGAYSYTELGEVTQPLPVDFVPAAGQAVAHPALTYLGVPKLDAFLPEGPYIPWGKARLTEPKTQFAVCLTVQRDDLKPDGKANPSLVVAAKDQDPRALGAGFVPLIEVPCGNLQAMRNPTTAGGLIQRHVRAFSNFVFVISE